MAALKYNGKPCRRCGETERYLPKKECVNCVKEYNRTYREENHKKLKAYQKAWYETNREKVREQERKKYDANREKVLERNRKYREVNREKMLEQQHKRYEANREKMQERDRNRYKVRREQVIERVLKWQVTHPEAVRVKNQRRRARKLNAPVNDLTATEWRATLWGDFNGHCAYCGALVGAGLPVHQEHVVPLSRGGSHTRSNVVPACPTCNLRKNAKTAPEFVRQVYGFEVA